MAALLYGTAVRTLIAMGFAATFGAAGLVHLAGPRFLKQAYCRARHPGTFYRNAGLWMLLVAVLLAFPGTRIAGAVLGVFLVFAGTELMLERVRYFTLAPAALILGALLPFLIATLRGW